ncbi:MAG: beta-galactosidase, partial [Bdellovibrionales bacterium]|nr:beta-galactosidase [Bdellovibrionales bacterium]
MLKGWILAGAVFGFIQFSSLAHSRVEIRNHQLFVDSQPEPFLFGAELQYFRLRGGHGPNIPAEKVYGLWAKALEQMQKAGMNALSFYVPWDFHEYREGKFDFTGTADEDKDGRPDYPSRNVLHFIELARQYGFKRIMARPGPYINAEWGFLGFGAIPLWFHEKYPDSHMRDSKGRRTKLYDYQNPDFLKATRRWFQALYDQVLKSILDEKGSPLLFVQLDNETNFMWQSIYNHNYSHQAISRYRKYLRQKYFWLGRLNRVHGQNYKRWSEVFPPFVPGINLLQDQDWYRFNDLVIFDYLRKIRKMWEDIGISENEVIFTLAESYNATKNGLLPNFRYRSWPKETGMMTLNLYPKTYESGELLNFPFKADLDVKSMIQANKLYNGHQEWLLGPEIQGGWWKGIDVSPASRLQTYLTTIGHGLKALFIYYFTEGQNWQHDWAYYQIKPLFEVLALEQGFKNTPSETLPDSFWAELGKRVDENLVVGFDVKKIILEGPDAGADLYFDAPLDGEAQPRPHFHILEELGKKLVKEKGFFLAGAVELSDSVGLLKDLECHAPSLDTQLDNVDLSSNWAGGLLGFLLQAGVNPKIIHTHLEDKKSLSKFDFLFRQDCGTPD